MDGMDEYMLWKRKLQIIVPIMNKEKSLYDIDYIEKTSHIIDHEKLYKLKGTISKIHILLFHIQTLRGFHYYCISTYFFIDIAVSEKFQRTF